MGKRRRKSPPMTSPLHQAPIETVPSGTLMQARDRSLTCRVFTGPEKGTGFFPVFPEIPGNIFRVIAGCFFKIFLKNFSRLFQDFSGKIAARDRFPKKNTGTFSHVLEFRTRVTHTSGSGCCPAREPAGIISAASQAVQHPGAQLSRRRSRPRMPGSCRSVSG
jgi:hypothetical protein